MAVYRGYCRVSDKKKQGLSIPDQIDFLTLRAKELGLPIVLYQEKESGREKDNREEYLRLLNEAEKGDYAGFIDVERFGRDVEYNAGTYKALKKKGVMIQVAGISYDPDLPAHKALFDMQSVFAEYVAESNKKKSRDVMWRMKVNGDWPFTGDMLGYKVIRTGKKKRRVEVIGKEAETVKYIFDRYSKGDISYNKLGNELKALGMCNRSGRYLKDNQVRDIIHSPIYMGYYKLRTTGRKRKELLHDLNPTNFVKSNLYTQIIADNQEEAEELWWKCLHIAKTTIRAHESHYSKTRITNNPLSGLIRCGICNDGAIYDNRHKAYVIHYCTCKGFNLKTFKMPFFPAFFDQLFYFSYLFKDSIKEIIDKEKIDVERMKIDYQKRIADIEHEKKDLKKEIVNLAKAQAAGADMGEFIKEKQDQLIEKDELIKSITISISTTQQRVDEIIDEFSDESIQEFREGNRQKKKRLFLTHLSARVYEDKMIVSYNHSNMKATIPLKRGMRPPLQFTISKGKYYYPELSYDDSTDKLEIIGKIRGIKDEVFIKQLETLGDRINGI